MTLEADGIIDVWEIETGKVVAQYEGLEVHEDMQSILDMKRRIVELEKQLEWQVDVANAFMERHELAIKANMQQSETIARLEQDNKRLRHLDAMPLDAMERYYRGTVYTPAAAQRYDYMPDDYDTDSAEIYHWLFPQDGDA